MCMNRLSRRFVQKNVREYVEACGAPPPPPRTDSRAQLKEIRIDESAETSEIDPLV